MPKYINVEEAIRVRDEEPFMYVYHVEDLDAFLAEVPAADVVGITETIDWCRNKIKNEKTYGLSGKRLEGYEQAMNSFMSYLHSKKGDHK